MNVVGKSTLHEVVVENIKVKNTISSSYGTDETEGGNYVDLQNILEPSETFVMKIIEAIRKNPSLRIALNNALSTI
jgi:hypothetical protein